MEECSLYRLEARPSTDTSWEGCRGKSHFPLVRPCRTPLLLLATFPVIACGDTRPHGRAAPKAELRPSGRSNGKGKDKDMDKAMATISGQAGGSVACAPSGLRKANRSAANAESSVRGQCERP